MAYTEKEDHNSDSPTRYSAATLAHALTILRGRERTRERADRRRVMRDLPDASR
jgi:hypothetical protein